MNYTEVKIHVPTSDTERASGIAVMTVPYGIYIEDYSDLEEGAWEIAHIDLIDEELLEKNRKESIMVRPTDLYLTLNSVTRSNKQSPSREICSAILY